MRNFLSFIRDSEKTRLDIFCHDEEETRELSRTLKKGFKFYVIYAIEDSLLAFRVGEYSEVKEVMSDLKRFYGFEWDGEPDNFQALCPFAEGLFSFYKLFSQKRRIFNKLYSIYKIVTKRNLISVFFI